VEDVYVVGVGMDRFGRFPDKSFIDHGVAAAGAALDDAGVEWADAGALYCGAAGVGLIPGNRVVDELGRNGAEIVNIDNASASGASAFRQACLAVAEGRTPIALAVGVGKMQRDAFGANMAAWLGGGEQAVRRLVATGMIQPAAVFAMVARRRMHETGCDPTIFARVAVKSHHHGALNPYSHFQQEVTLEEVLASRMVADPLRLLDCCPTSDGGAAAVVTTRAGAERLGRHPLVRVLASQAMSDIHLHEPWGDAILTRAAAARAYEEAGVGPADLDLFQVHDAFSSEEIEYYEALDICGPGEAEKLVLEGATEIGGRIPCNTDGGLLSRGHPLGPTGLAQIWETVVQLRGQAGARQVDGARTGLIQLIGAGNVCLIHILQRV
jgi:acetyl-CoA acetyltransferase